MSDSIEEVFRCLVEYQNVKIYTSNIVDIVIVASVTVANIAIVAYYLDGLSIKNHVFKPTKKQSIETNEVCFINGYYELFVDATAQAALEYENIIFKQDFKTSVYRNSLKISTIKISTFLTIVFIDTTFKIISGTTRFTDFLNFDTVVVGSEGNVVVLETLKGLFQQFCACSGLKCFYSKDG